MKTAEKRQGSSAQAPPRPEVAPLALSCTAKISPAHLEKLAIVYVRQSTPHQVLDNRESTARQYAFADQAVAFGWPRQRVLTIDEDLGKSGRTAEGRSGFQRLISEVTLDHVGMVLGLEMSRLARSSKDWHVFFEMCAVYDTLIADQDGVYDGKDANDRLLLGLKGIMSEMELHIMRNRLNQGLLHKAQRGELFFSVPLGYVLLPTGKVALDPDEQARAVVQLLFDKFDELGTVYALFHWLLEHGVSLPIRPQRGVNKGRLEWRHPSLTTLAQTLHHPMYAGAYAYGRRAKDRKAHGSAGKRRRTVWLPVDQWQVLIRDHLPAYITWERFLSNEERLKQNQPRCDTRGTPRQGCALLPGLLICGRCDWRMQVNYGTKNKPRYCCPHDHASATEKGCAGLSAKALDEFVSGQVLRALEPAALELSLKAQTDLRRERERLEKHWQQKFQRARYDVELAERRYQAVDPDNRLVAGTLERQWEDALRCERELKEECDRCRRQTFPQLSDEDELRITALASDIPALWQSPKTTNVDRQAMVRCLVDRVVVHVEPNSEQTEATIHWAGGYESRIAFARPVRTYGQRSDFDQIIDRIVCLRDAGNSLAATARILKEEGFAPLRSGCFNSDLVRNLLRKRELPAQDQGAAPLRPCEWRLRDLAHEVGMPWQTLRDWAANGWAHARQTKIQKAWIIWADNDEVQRLRKLRAATSGGTNGYPAELITPKPKASD